MLVVCSVFSILTQAALDRLHSGRTTLVIAHRLSTVSNTDLITIITITTITTNIIIVVIIR